MSTKKHDVPEEQLSALLANYKNPETPIGEYVLVKFRRFGTSVWDTAHDATNGK